MNYRIYKYPLAVTDVQNVGLPLGARILSVGAQDDKLVLWALVDGDRLSESRARRIRIFGTGNPVERVPFAFLGTVQIPPFVWHVFEESP